MNKAIIDQMLPEAYKVLQTHGIAKNGEVVKTYRSQITTLGVAINGGSLLAAIAFFSSKNQSVTDRPALLECIKDLIQVPEKYQSKPLFDYVLTQKQNEAECKERIIHAAIALKLAMNLYTLVDEKKQTTKNKEG